MGRTVILYYERSPNDLYTVRGYNWHDGWFDIQTNLSEADAVAYWTKETDNGKHDACYDHGDYIAIFPANTRMIFQTVDSED